MQIKATTPEQYTAQLPDERKTAIEILRKTIQENLPEGYEEIIDYGMIAYVVPHSIYPKGYHCNPKQALPFMYIASQKNFIAIYHMGLYANPALLSWFTTEYPLYSTAKLDIGKSCIRFKKPENIPFDLIAALCRKMTIDDWIKCYESNLKK
ncbi:MAG: DUF1801 domain-containing protein [Bacteroidetes bacterium]|nr:DUF1801 domain-containing protein [Bacteroidota bacterium]